MVAAGESARNGDKKIPMLVPYWDTEADDQWYGLFRVCSMKDKTGDTQARLIYDAMINGLGYPPETFMWCLSDNTASVSSETVGCVALLEKKLKAYDINAGPSPAPGKGRGRGGRGGRPRGGKDRRRGRGRGRGRAAATLATRG